jgi:hypothetical protein
LTCCRFIGKSRGGGEARLRISLSLPGVKLT